MATELATAYLSLIPTLKGAGKSIQNELDGINVDPSGKKMGKQLGDGLTDGAKSGSSGIMSALGGIAKVAGPALAAIGFSQLVGEAAAATDATQKFKSTLDFAGLGAPEIEALSKSTRKYADETVYALSDIQNITAQLAANSVPNYDKLAEAAGNLNAVAGGNAETFKSVGMVLTQTAGAGKLTTENWNQLADAIPGASGKLQEAMKANGAYTGDFREAMANGEITAEEFNKAIMDLGFTDAAVEAATSTQTIEGAVGNLQAAFVGLGSDIITAIKPALTGSMTAIADFVGGIGTSVGEAGGILNEYIANFSEKFNEINTEMGGMATVGDVVACAIQELGGAFGLTAAQTAPFANMMATLVDTFAPIVEQVQAQLMPALSTLGGAITNLAGAVMPLIMAAIQALAPVVASAISAIISVATTLAQTLAPAIDGIAQIIQAVLPVAQAAFEVFGSAVKGVVNAVFPFVQTLITSVMNVINAVISTVLALIQGDWEGVWNGVKAVASSVWEGIKGIVSAGIEAVRGVINSALSVIESLWSGAWNALGDLLNGAWNSFVETVSGGNERVMGLLRDLPGKITSLFSGAGSWLINAGKSIINGLLDGLKNAWGNVTGFIGGIGDWIVSHKGPPSYDAVMLTKNGELIMRGLLDGMTSGWGDVEDFIGSRNASISASYAVSPTYSPRDFTPSASGDGSAVIEWLECNLGDIISDRTPVMGSRDFARMSRRAVGYGI